MVEIKSFVLLILIGLFGSASCQTVSSADQPNYSVQTKNEPLINLCVNTKPPDDHTQMINFDNEPLIQNVKFFENGEIWLTTGSIINQAFRSKDSGESWEKLRFQNIDLISSFSFVDERKGFLSDNESNLYQTGDGGKTWTKVETDKAFDKKVKIYGIDKIKFTSFKNGFITTKIGEIYETSNGGKNWKQINLPSKAEYVAAFFLNDKNFWIASRRNLTTESNSIYLTAKAQNSWKTYKLPQQSNFADWISVFFNDENHGWIASDSGNLTATTDGGKNWRQIDTGTQKIVVRSMFWQNAESGWLAGSTEQNQATLLKTEDGGKFWKTVLTKNERFFTEVFFVSPTTGWLLSRSRIYKTTNGGETWNLIVSSTLNCK